MPKGKMCTSIQGELGTKPTRFQKKEVKFGKKTEIRGWGVSHTRMKNEHNGPEKSK